MTTNTPSSPTGDLLRDIMALDKEIDDFMDDLRTRASWDKANIDSDGTVVLPARQWENTSRGSPSPPKETVMSEIPKGLVERIEAATEGSRELDREIVTALYGEPVYDAEQPWGTYWNIDGCDVEEDDIPSYTTSIDVAMTLAPDHLKSQWSLIGGTSWQAEVGDELADAATPALALVSACLRAHMTQENPNGRQ